MSTEAMTKVYIQRAGKNLKVSQILKASGEDVLEQQFFYNLSSAQDSLRGFLTFNRVRAGVENDLRSLSVAISRIDPNLFQILEPTEKIARLSDGFDYSEPNGKLLNSEMVLESFKLAKVIYQEVTSRVPFDAQWEI